jgi:Transcriptional regulatory protein, C terminal
MPASARQILSRQELLPMSRQELLSMTRGTCFDRQANLVDVYVRYLRRKLGGARDRDRPRDRVPAATGPAQPPQLQPSSAPGNLCSGGQLKAPANHGLLAGRQAHSASPCQTNPSCLSRPRLPARAQPVNGRLAAQIRFT